MKIKLINYPYNSHEVGETCDFGEAINLTLVGQQRAVWATPLPIQKAAPVNDEPKPLVVEKEDQRENVVTAKKSSPAPAKKLLQNNLRDKVQAKTQNDAKSFWDRLK